MHPITFMTKQEEMTKTKFILRCAFLILGWAIVYALVFYISQGCKTIHLVRYSPIENDRYYASDFAPKKRWYYYQIKGSKIDSVYCCYLHSFKGCLYAEYGNASQRKLIHCGTFKIIDR